MPSPLPPTSLLLLQNEGDQTHLSGLLQGLREKMHMKTLLTETLIHSFKQHLLSAYHVSRHVSSFYLRVAKRAEN